MKIGVLALQGAFLEHEQMFSMIGVNSFEIRNLQDFNQPIDGLVLPGGESTVQAKLLKDTGLLQPIRKAIINGLPVFGTCAGLILLASALRADDFERIATMDTVVRRNAYGRQLESFQTESQIHGVGDGFPMVFIRAPYIEEVTEEINVLAEINGHIVAARQGNQLVTAFHPELTDDWRVHRYFVEQMIAQ